MFATKTALTTLAALVASVTGIAEVDTGVPLKLGKQASAYVALAGQNVSDTTTGLLVREARYWVVFAYRTDGDVSTAEQQVADWIDGFTTAFYRDRTLGTEAQHDRWTASLDAQAAEHPAYAPFAGQEVRLYPLVITVTQRQTYPSPS